MLYTELNKIYRGDCLEILDKVSCDVDILVTDIPYNISKEVHTDTIGRRLDYGEWDKQKNEDIYNRLFMATNKVKTACYIFASDYQFSYIYSKLKQCGWLVRCLVWLKPNPNVINCDKLYAPSQELIIYAKKRGALYNPKYKKSYFTYSSPVGKKRFHPNQKPIKLIEEFILDSTNEKDIVLDPFAGSGTTLLAALNTGRYFIGIESEQKYVDIANKRIKEVRRVLP